jgi:NAD(P)-dependent dehydrogenase (short-subunit alcohol dehydrogenase family)
MTEIRGAAAITGAASGIGRALALEFAARGCDLALADRDEAGLQAVAAEIAKTSSQKVPSQKATPPKVTVHRVDVSEPAEIADFAQAAASAHPGLNIVVNNAGVALLGQFSEIDQAQMDWLMNINFWGVVHSTRAFLPHLARQREATSSTSPASSASSRRPDKPLMPRRNSRCAAFRKRCGTSCRWRRAR